MLTLARELGISLGSINFCFKSLVEKGWIRMQNFNQSKNKLRYVYLCTSKGVSAKCKQTAEFLSYKLSEYDALHQQNEKLKIETVFLKGSIR